MENTKLWEFKEDISSIALPDKFTFPFFYQPHPLAVLAAEQLQKYLSEEFNGEHNFGLGQFNDLLPIGKMFGVLVVQSPNKKIQFLAAFSGKLGESNHYLGFAPPVYDILEENSFFLQGEQNINKQTLAIAKLESGEILETLKSQHQEVIERIEEEKKNKKALIKQNKKARDEKRKDAHTLPVEIEDLKLLNEELNEQSKKEQIELKHLQKKWNLELEQSTASLNSHLSYIERLKQDRREYSNALQQSIFEEYTFVDNRKETRSLRSIFEDTIFQIPPAGAGECAAPKLLQYAFLNKLKPICMAEFWWGASPKSEVRKHKQYYPACKGKCEPILGHMLRHTELDENPLLFLKDEDVPLEIIYEDDQIIVINKPAELLSVPGNTPLPSVYTKILKMRPDIEGPIIVHRLDMSTSGVMILTKTNQAYFSLQRQFIKRKTKKTYIALLEGEISGEKGIIELPLSQDILDRPKQKVDYDSGKEAVTYWEVMEVKDGKTRIKFHPKTGRTHQLRVHAAHHQGLNSPIVGDDLYGNISERLHLHAFRLVVIHPTLNKEMTFKIACPF
ncbi:MAG: RNA pseudouridine synthase [Bacteroidetes bacterium]|nr:RNA pseudouridine synthase [Bacteroidota bacterium]